MKQQEAVHSAPVAPPPGLYSVQLDPLSSMSKKQAVKLETDMYEILAWIFLRGVFLLCCQVRVQQVRPLV